MINHSIQHPNHHPDEALMYHFASGCTEEALNLILATHIYSCPQCQLLQKEAEDVCGHIFSTLPIDDEDMNGSFDALWNVIGQSHHEQGVSATIPKITQSPLETYLERNRHRLKVKNTFPRISETILPLSNDRIKVSIMDIGAGVKIPPHTHVGYELTQVLSGGFYDQKGSYHSGDLTIKDSSDNHSPTIFDDEPCQCLVVRCGDLKFTGSMSLIYNSLFKFLD